MPDPTPLAPVLIDDGFNPLRNPGTQVIFLGEETFAYDSDLLLSVETVKTMGQPAGTFRIVLKATAAPDQKSGALNLSGVGESDITANWGDPDSNEGGFWFARIKPMMLVQIIFSSKRVTNRLGFATPTSSGIVGGSDSNGTINALVEEITMLGVVDTVSLIKQVGPGGNQRVIQVTGRDMGRCFTDDTHFVFPFPFLNPKTGQPTNGLVHYLNGTAEKIKKLVARYFFRSKDDDVPQFRDIYARGTVGEVIDTLFENASGLDVKLRNNVSLRDYLPKPLFPDVSIRSIPFLGQRLLTASGSVWSLFQQVVPKPFGEMFVDTVGNRARMIIRRPPWGRLWKDLPEQLDKLIEQRGNVSDPIAAYVRSKKGTLWDRDEVVTTPCRVVDRNYHEIIDREIIAMNLSKSDREVVNLYWTLASSNWAGGEKSPYHTAGLVTPMMDVESVAKYGLRMYSQENSWWNPKEVDSYGLYGKVNIQAELILDNLRLYFWFRDNAQLISGSLTIRGRSTIRIGDYVKLMNEDHIFYVESVANSWTYGGSFITTLGLTRGQPVRDNRLAKNLSQLHLSQFLKNSK